MKKLMLACAALVLAACSAQPQASRPEVASLTTPGVGPASASATSQEQRPRERLDMTPEDHAALIAPWLQCLAEHGVDKKAPTQPKELVDKANAACASKMPLPPWEKDASNPEALDFANRVVQCLRQKGVRYVEVSREPGSEQVGVSYGGPNNDQESITLGLRYTQECEIEASKR
ncbi:hypothetical protein KIPE111705_25840 [Kibdelosporangium persicum]|uniref:PASTA domain-containing protein n=1 Tax=Kibdelosporangium persicum TaxID=2698649 RepID=A0ABX2FIL6_9PSEU|nr:hypothetical protein [Kibdelosporangium persicum]NRN70606.1 hypothetical protein [Kibdelosporangium persicum]